MDPAQVTIALIAAGLIILIAFPIHEFSHALAAYRLGDSTARWQGRLTLDPRRHFDPLGGAMLIISSILGFGVGWAKPTPVNPYNLRYDELMTTIATSTIATIVWNIVFYLFAINISLFVFNLLPIPPLDGWKVLLGLVDARTAFSLRQFEQYGLILLAFIVLFGGRLLIPVLDFLLNLFAPGATYLPIPR